MRNRDIVVGVIFWVALASAILATLWLDWFFAGFFYGSVVGCLLTAYAAGTDTAGDA